MSNQETKQTAFNPIGLGIIGAGLAFKQLHWPALTALPGCFKVRAVCDVETQARSEVAEMGAKLNQEQYGEQLEVTQESDYRTLLARSDVEAVLIALPIHLNAEVELESALAGKHILCEKPLAANLNQGRRLVAELEAISAEKKLVIEIAENYHYRQELIEAHKWAFEEKLIGEVVMIQAQQAFWLDINQGFASTPWRMDNQYRGGLVMDGGLHFAALLRRIGGEIEQIQAFTKQVHPAMTSADTLSLSLRYRNGVLGQLLYSGGVGVPDWNMGECHIYGTTGTIKTGRSYARLYQRQEQPNPKLEDATLTRSIEADKSGYYLEFLNFYEAVRLGKPVVVTPGEALRDLEVIMAALDSAEERRVILL